MLKVKRANDQQLYFNMLLLLRDGVNKNMNKLQVQIIQNVGLKN